MKNPPIQKINFWKNVNVGILRDDLVHPFVSGNKWRKLKYNIEDFRFSAKKAILTFGGAFSNHLVATAAASRMFGFDVIGVVRGEKVQNDYLDFVQKCGMKLHFISRSDYKRKTEKDFLEQLLNSLSHKLKYDDYFIIPEGGSNEAAIKGVRELVNDTGEFDYIISACGTGATIAGIARGLTSGQTAIGISVLKAEGYIAKQIFLFNGNTERVEVFDGYHFGGYAKSNSTLEKFINLFSSTTKIPAEPVYTGKMFFAVNDLIRQNYFPANSKILLVHTGGIFDFEGNATSFLK